MTGLLVFTVGAGNGVTRALIALIADRTNTVYTVRDDVPSLFPCVTPEPKLMADRVLSGKLLSAEPALALVSAKSCRASGY